jgi:precorrin-6Y C5,15-methyltransferase (decarboxylating)
MRFIVIGITDNPQPFFPPEVQEIINNGKVFSGGKRHHEIVAPLLPPDAEWIDITVPLDAVFERYESLGGKIAEHCVMVFASGDPLFFGFANTIRRKMPEAEVVTFPAFNSLQMLAHRLVMPYHDMRIVSLTGRPWPEFDRALIERAPKIGILTDREHTPAAIAQRMLDYGYKGYTMHIGEHLGHPSQEKVTTLTLEEATRRIFSHPNCLILCSVCCDNVAAPAKSFGIPDTAFSLLNGREKMITKMPIRLLSLQALDLPRRHVLWDIGACTGSVSIEARLLFPHLQVEAFEVRPECEAIIRENTRRFGAPGISLHIGDFRSVCCDAIAAPDAVFIGGHGGHLKEIIAKVLSCLRASASLHHRPSLPPVIVMNSVTSPVVEQVTHGRPDSHTLWNEACRELGLRQEPPLRIQLNDYNPIEILKATQEL